jgi:hypothetical protein
MNWMLRRLIPLVLAVVVGALPMVRDFCQLSCAEAGSAAQSAQPAHHHHSADAAEDQMAGRETGALAAGDRTPSADHHSIQGVPHGCTHSESWQAAVSPSTKLVIAAPTVVSQVVYSAAFDLVDAPLALVDLRPRSPILGSLRTPLRV